MNPSIKSIVPTAVACALVLAACGGGGAKPAASFLPDAERARTLTGSTAPTETAEQISARVAGILGRSDSLIISTMRGSATIRRETTNPPDPLFFTFQTDCRATACSYRETETGMSGTIRLRDLEIISSTRGGPVLTRNGITLGEVVTNDLEAYGAWMLHSAFGVQSGRGVIGGPSRDFSIRYALAGGDPTGSLPPEEGISATWTGVMVGTPATGPAAGNILQGDATLTATFASGPRWGTLDALFTNIKDIDRLAAHTTETVRFDDMAVGSDGRFEAGLTGDRIQGRFYGPGHVEAAGVFERSNILGAFGAKRQ